MGHNIEHSNPFEQLEIPKNDFNLSQEFLNKYAIPYYRHIPLIEQDKSNIEIFKKNKLEFAPIILSNLLGDSNWRTQQTGAYFVAINNFNQFEEIIGKLLLKSELYFAGRIFALTLGHFNTITGLQYLLNYLDYYLTTINLYYDQREVLDTVKYLDEVNKTRNFDKYEELWEKFIYNKPFWIADVKTEDVRRKINAIKEVQKHQ